MPRKRTYPRAASERRPKTMRNIIEFPKASPSEAREAGLTVTFELDYRQFAIGSNITELNQNTGELIPMPRKRR
jgi:hypothetical protein